MEGAGRGAMFLAGLPLAHLTHTAAELSFPPGNHLTLIKGGRGDSGEKKDGSVSTLGKSSLERLEDSPGNSSQKEKGRKLRRARKNNIRTVPHFERC